jgi:phytanoyl-CoA hydroxylase
MRTQLTAAEWAQYERDGYLRLGKVLADEELAALQQRIDDIMLGRAPVGYDRMLMQLDRVPGETDAPGPQTKGHKGATLRYRKIQDLEYDPLFLTYLQQPLFRHICTQIYGPQAAVACFRAMFMNKPAREGTVLVWHQDRWTHLDRDPLITIWTALDPATQANGCVEIIPGAHHCLINPEHNSGFLTDEQAAELLQKNERVYLELAAGEAVLLHNYLPHGSGVNSTDIPRRAFSVCYMDAATKASNGEHYPRVFGKGALAPA